MLLCAFHGLVFAENWTHASVVAAAAQASGLPSVPQTPPDCCVGCSQAERHVQLDTQEGMAGAASWLDHTGQAAVAPIGRTHVVYAADTAMFPGLFSSMLSLSRHLADPAGCTIHLLVAAEHVHSAQGLVHCFRAALRHSTGAVMGAPLVQVHRLRPLPFNLTDLTHVGRFRSDFLKPQPFVRLFLHEYLPMLDRVIWLDADTVVQADISILYRMRMQHVLAAALETSPGRPRHALCWMLAECRLEFSRLLGPLALETAAWDAPEFSSGVMVVDLKRWRSSALTHIIVQGLEATSGCKGDQAALNLAVAGQFDQLPWHWNLQLEGSARPGFPSLCTADASILHFCGEPKPWAAWVPHQDLYNVYSSTQCAFHAH